MLRPRTSRSKTGCLCCRLRRKKCDEAKPACDNCTKLHLICSWVDPGEFAWRKRLGLSPTASMQQYSEMALEPLTPDSGIYLGSKLPHDSCQTVQSSPSSRSPDNIYHNSNIHSLDAQPPPRLTSPSCSFSSSSLIDLHLSDAAATLIKVFFESTCQLLFSVPSVSLRTFKQRVLELALSDSLIMNAVLGVGGFLPNCDQIHHKLEAERLRHYVAAIEELKSSLATWTSNSAQEALRLLLATSLLSLNECIRGNDSGSFFQHLQANHYFASIVFESRWDPDDSTFIGILLEQHAYWQLASCLRLVPSQTQIDTLRQSPLLQLDGLRQTKTFGVLFGSASSLYQLAPSICQLAINRELELTTGDDLGCFETMESLSEAVREWELEDTRINECVDGTESMVAGKVVQLTMLLFLYSAYHKDPVYLRSISTPLVDEGLAQITILKHTPWMNSLFWPLIVISTHASTVEHQATCMDVIPQGLILCDRVRECLRWLWDEPGTTFGLTGFETVLKTHKVDFVFG